MTTTFAAKLENFRLRVETETIRRLHEQKLDCEANILNARVTIKPGQKYVKVDIGSSGRFMVEVATGNIFGIKGYGQVHRGHFYGTLETTGEYFWGEYYPHRLDGTLGRQKANGCPEITHAPVLVPAPVDTVCPDGPACDDPACRRERMELGLPVADPVALVPDNGGGNIGPNPDDVCLYLPVA